MKLMIDDTRDETNVSCQLDMIARNYFTGIMALKQENFKWDVLYLDHDLHTYDYDGKEWTGYDVMVFLENNPKYLPGKIICVSDNPHGRARIEQVIKKLYGE